MKELLDLAKIAGYSAGKEILKHYDSYKLYEKQDKSPLTSADIVANEKIFEILSKSGYEICSEETILDEEKRTSNSTFWLVDPLDGTKEFIKKNGEFCVCIALIKNSRPVLASIYIPTKDEIFYSGGNKEIYKNNSLIKPKPQTPNLSLLGRSSKSKKREIINAKFNFVPFSLGSAIKFCHLVENKAGIYARFGDSYIWDNAAGDFLVEQSGGMVIDLKTGDKPLYAKKLLNNHFLALDKNNIYLKDEILKFINETF